MKVLVTGSSGRIGGYLVKLLGGHTLMLIDKNSGFDLSKEPMNDLVEFEPDIIFHLAASFERTDESPEFLITNYYDNMKASLRLNQAIAKMKNVKKVVFASSYLVYNPMRYLSSDTMSTLYPMDEDCSTHTQRNLCGAAKIYTENELNFIQRNINKDMKLCHARIFRVYGENGHEFISRCADWKKLGVAVDIWKSENRFDFIHAEDVAKALYHLGFSECDGIYNVGSGESHSIQQVIDAIGCKVRKVPAPDGELYESSCADISKIKATGWEPKITFKEGIKRVLAQ